MSNTGKVIRLHRIFRAPGAKALIVAYDHALMLGPIPGTEHPGSQIHHIAKAGVNAILVSLGTLKNCVKALLVPDPPAIIARLDWTNVWYRAGAVKTGEYRSTLVAQVEDAVRCGADAVVTYMFMGSGDPAQEAEEIAKNAAVARECERLGVPHVIESMARGRDAENPGDPKWVRLHTRIASELGADLIKTDYTGDAESMRSVVAACPTPVLAAGGPRQGSDEDALKMVRGVVQAGGAGVIFGRNVFQAEDMDGFLNRARAILSGAQT